jgi:hypothetical protein
VHVYLPALSLPDASHSSLGSLTNFFTKFLKVLGGCGDATPFATPAGEKLLPLVSLLIHIGKLAGDRRSAEMLVLYHFSLFSQQGRKLKMNLLL